MATLKTAITDWLRIKTQVGTPATPASGYSVIYEEGGVFKMKTSAGVVTEGLTNPMIAAGDTIYGGASGVPTRLAKGTGLQIYRMNAGATAAEWVTPAAGSLNDYILVREEQNSGTAGGTATSGSFQTRVINREVSDTGGHCSLPGSNVIRLAAGTYRYKIQCPAFQVNSHQARLYDVTAGAAVTDGEGSVAYSRATSSNGHTPSIIAGVFTIAGSNDFRVEHRVEATVSGNGWGIDAAFGIKNIFTVAEFWKVA